MVCKCNFLVFQGIHGILVRINLISRRKPGSIDPFSSKSDQLPTKNMTSRHDVLILPNTNQGTCVGRLWMVETSAKNHLVRLLGKNLSEVGLSRRSRQISHSAGLADSGSIGRK